MGSHMKRIWYLVKKKLESFGMYEKIVKHSESSD